MIYVYVHQLINLVRLFLVQTFNDLYLDIIYIEKI
jgi:hypothetical protein